MSGKKDIGNGPATGCIIKLTPICFAETTGCRYYSHDLESGKCKSSNSDNHCNNEDAVTDGLYTTIRHLLPYYNVEKKRRGDNV